VILRRKKHYKNEKTNVLFITKNTHKDIFDILKTVKCTGNNAGCPKSFLIGIPKKGKPIGMPPQNHWHIMQPFPKPMTPLARTQLLNTKACPLHKSKQAMLITSTNYHRWPCEVWPPECLQARKKEVVASPKQTTYPLRFPLRTNERTSLVLLNIYTIQSWLVELLW